MSHAYEGPVDHPGTYLLEEIEARGWNQRDLAYILGVSERTISQIISGKSGISADMAKALASAFEVSPDLFLSMQNDYDLWAAGDPEASVKTRARVSASYPLREMVRRGWLLDERDPTLMELQLSRFFGVETLDRVPHLRHAAKKTHYEDAPAQQIAWLFRVRQVAAGMSVPRYSKAGLEKAVREMRTMLRSPEDIGRVPRLLQDAGVRFIVVEGLSGGKIDGVCFWTDNQPVIGMTLRFDRIDNFWFVLRHEIEHVLQGDGREREIIDTEDVINASDAASISVEERRANEAAAAFCVPLDQMDSFFKRKYPYFHKADVEGFAERIGVHPGLVAGQIQRRVQRYNLLRDYLVRVREYLTENATIDGWGVTLPSVA